MRRDAGHALGERRLSHQPEPEIARRHACGAAAGAGIADEVGDIAAMPALRDPHAAIGGAAAVAIERDADEA